MGITASVDGFVRIRYGVDAAKIDIWRLVRTRLCRAVGRGMCPLEVLSTN
jgi:hypothetical protein